MNWRDRIDSDPQVIGGKPRVKDTRMGVAFLLGLFGSGWSIQDVLGVCRIFVVSSYYC